MFSMLYCLVFQHVFILEAICLAHTGHSGSSSSSGILSFAWHLGQNVFPQSSSDSSAELSEQALQLSRLIDTCCLYKLAIGFSASSMVLICDISTLNRFFFAMPDVVSVKTTELTE